MAEKLIRITLLYGQGYREEQISKKDFEKMRENIHNLMIL